MSEDETTVEVPSNEPERIEIIVRERKPVRPPICKQFDKVEHLKSPEWIENFKRLHPECFQ